jgi:APA family basic amino acid/polyamine antiporter
MAMTFGAYAAPSAARPLAIAAVVALTSVNLLGVQKTAGLTKVIVATVLAALALAVGSSWFGRATDLRCLWPPSTSAHGVAESAGFLFFAFAGHARLATLGEEVVEPERTIPRAIPLALGITFVVYATVLTYYAIANASAWTLERERRRLPRALALVGFCGSLALAATLPLSSIVAGAGVLAAGALAYWIRRATHRQTPSRRTRNF